MELVLRWVTSTYTHRFLFSFPIFQFQCFLSLITFALLPSSHLIWHSISLNASNIKSFFVKKNNIKIIWNPHSISTTQLFNIKTTILNTNKIYLWNIILIHLKLSKRQIIIIHISWKYKSKTQTAKSYKK